jgi:hypothetical protein
VGKRVNPRLCIMFDYEEQSDKSNPKSKELIFKNETIGVFQEQPFLKINSSDSRLNFSDCASITGGVRV